MTEGKGNKPDRSDMPSTDKDHSDGKADQGGTDHTEDGWAAYRNWMSRVSHSGSRQIHADSSIYTWKGYKDWAEKVKRNWEADS